MIKNLILCECLALQVGQGTYSNVYKARDKDTKKIVALKKVRFDTSEPESVKFMAREIMMLQKLDHPNIIKLEGLATSRMQYSLYLVFDFMQTDLHTIISRTEERLTEPQVTVFSSFFLESFSRFGCPSFLCS
jgi:cyclin-dependent kinase 12/13